MNKQNRKLMARPYEDTLDFTLTEFLRMSFAWAVIVLAVALVMWVLSAV